MTFSKWRQAMNSDGWFRTASREEKARMIVSNAYVSQAEGELSDRAFNAAINWAFQIDHCAALSQQQRSLA